MSQSTNHISPLLPQYAFVLQLRSDTQVEAGRVVGRVEHIVSGQATHFESLKTLLTFMARVLQEVNETSSEQGV